MLRRIRKMKKLGFLRDDRAQALTEIVIVIPLILLVFFVIMEYFQIVRVSQLGNYAAYVAARSYAVRMHEEEDDRESTAVKCASLAYAPVTWLKSGESFFGIDLGDAASDLTEAAGSGALGSIADMAMGFVVARYARLSSLGGGSVDYEVSGSGNSEQVKVTLHYSYPVGLPGLAELWPLIGGEDEEVEETFDRVGVPLLSSWLSSPYPYLDITSKCAMGLERWSGEPRERASVSSDAATDPELEEQAKEMEEAADAYEEAMAAEREAAEEYQEAILEREEAEQEYNDLLNDPEATQEEIDAAKAKLDAARLEETSKKNDWEDAKEATREAKEALEELTDTDFG